MGVPLRILVLVLIPTIVSSGASESRPDWIAALRQKIIELDETSEGNLGVFVKRLSDDTQLDYHATETWYLASTAKILVAIVLLQLQEEGVLSLREKLTLRESDYVDGAGALLSRKPGERFTIERLLELMLIESDSTATDLLIDRIGVRELNSRVKRMMPQGFGQLTSILDVRYEAYSQIHENAKNLTNRDFIELKRHRDLTDRFEALISKMGITKSQARVASIEEAFERYYQKGRNSGSLSAFGILLERLVEGDLLSSEGTNRLISLMESMRTGEKRIKAGLPPGIRFAQKTGTQVRRLCNVGILRTSPSPGSEMVVAACVAGYSSQEKAEAVLRALGSELARSQVLAQPNLRGSRTSR